MNVNIPGCLPRAFSDMPLSCTGTVSSILDDIDDAREAGSVGVDSAGVARRSSSVSSSSSSSSSSPIAKVPSSGTLLSEDVRRCPVGGLRVLSTDPRLLSEKSPGSRVSFVLLLRRSISSWPLSSVNERKAKQLAADFHTFRRWIHTIKTLRIS